MPPDLDGNTFGGSSNNGDMRTKCWAPASPFFNRSRGGQPKNSNLAMTSGLTLRVVFGLGLRQTHMWTAPTCKCFLQLFLIGSLAPSRRLGLRRRKQASGALIQIGRKRFKSRLDRGNV